MNDVTTVDASPQRGPFRWRLMHWIAWLGGIYIALVMLLMLLENTLLYHPVRASASWEPPPAGLAAEDVWLETSDGVRIHAWWLPRPGASGALLYCHGNAGNLSHRGFAVPPLMAALGESVLIFDYPGYGNSEGSPSETGCYAAADAAYLWLTQTQKIAGARIILFGKSLGGGVATYLALRHAHRALVLVKSFTSIPDMAQSQFPIFPARWLVRNKFDNLGKIGRCSRPVAIAHGDRDELVPLWMAEKLYEAAPEPKRFFLLKNCSHNGPLPAEFLTGLAEYLQEAAPK